MGNHKKVTDEEIKLMNNKIAKGESVLNICKEHDISRQAFYARKKELNIPNKRDANLPEDIKNIKIEDMYVLAKLLNTDYETIHKYINPKKTIFANKKRMSYLKNNSKENLEDAIKITILNYYDIQPIELIEILDKIKNVGK